MANEKENTVSTPGQLQKLVKKPSGDLINVRLIIDETNHYNELLPVEVVRAIIDPDVPDCFIQISGRPRIAPARCTRHFVHTSYIREILLLDELPEEKK